MRERIELLGGTFQVSSRPNQGTIVRAILPVPVLVEA
jgi:signal transduction histidine kinase